MFYHFVQKYIFPKWLTNKIITSSSQNICPVFFKGTGSEGNDDGGGGEGMRDGGWGMGRGRGDGVRGRWGEGETG
jgi:hypothetical protein